jgi:hypothetical protein
MSRQQSGEGGDHGSIGPMGPWPRSAALWQGQFEWAAARPGQPPTGPAAPTPGRGYRRGTTSDTFEDCPRGSPTVLGPRSVGRATCETQRFALAQPADDWASESTGDAACGWKITGREDHRTRRSLFRGRQGWRRVAGWAQCLRLLARATPGRPVADVAACGPICLRESVGRFITGISGDPKPVGRKKPPRM